MTRMLMVARPFILVGIVGLSTLAILIPQLQGFWMKQAMSLGGFVALAYGILAFKRAGVLHAAPREVHRLSQTMSAHVLEVAAAMMTLAATVAMA